MAQGTPSALYERLGGDAGVKRLVHRFYERVLADEELAPYFAGVAMDKLRRMQFEFFAAALGGPVAYSGRSLAAAHHGRGITREHVQRFLDHLLNTIERHGERLEREEVRNVVSRISVSLGDITGEAPMAG